MVICLVSLFMFNGKTANILCLLHSQHPLSLPSSPLSHVFSSMQFNLPTGKHVEVSIHKSLARFRHNLALMGWFLNFPCIKPYFGFKKIKPREVIFRFSLSTLSSVKSHQHYFPCDFFPSLVPTAFEICSRKGGHSEYFVSVRIGAKYGKIHLFPLLGRCTLCYCHE